MALTLNGFISPQALRSGSALATTANTNYSATPTNVVTLFAAHATNGSRLIRLGALSLATLTACELQLFRDGDGTGTTKRFFKSRLMLAYTVAQTTAQTDNDFGYSDSIPLILAPGEKVYAAIGVTNTGIVFTADGYDY